MFNLIEKLRQKPDRAKKQVAFFTAFFVAGVIFVVWLSVLYPSFRKDQSHIEQVTGNGPSPISTFADSFFAGTSAIQEKISEMKAAVSSFGSDEMYPESTSTTPSLEPVIE